MFPTSLHTTPPSRIAFTSAILIKAKMTLQMVRLSPLRVPLSKLSSHLVTPSTTCGFLLEEENALFTGDNALGHGFTVVEDLGLYLQSLDRMAEQACSIGYPAHGVRIENLPAKLNHYTKQRRAREKLIYSALLDNMLSRGRNANSSGRLWA